MSLVTVGKKRNRVYERAFDHEEAQRLHAEGLSYEKLAERFGVSTTSIQRVCKPDKAAAMARRSAQWMRDQREPCKGGCGALVWQHVKGRSGFCPSCWGERRAAQNVRDDELRCTKCGEWKPDEDFYAVKRKTRRGRKPWCRACETAARQRNRRENPERERKVAREYKRKGKKMSKFIVLRKADDNGTWTEHAHIEAASRRHAIEKTADQEGEYAATTEGQLTSYPVRPMMALKIVEEDD